MHTLVQTPQEIFNLPQHLTVPLFQRAYVWTEEDQLAPLWSDIRRLTELRMRTGNVTATHFLGAVVLQQQISSMGAVSAYAVIDGQQRLTTLQLLMDASTEALASIDAEALSQQLFALTHNADHFGLSEDELLKVQHTNKDRGAFHEVMNAPGPVDYDGLEHRASLIVQAHQFFSAEITSWLSEVDDEERHLRASHLVHVLSRGLQLVTITLQPDENSQEIFETLNARGTPLTAADLIKNFVFQRIENEGGSAEKAYRERWSLFEHPFWEHEIGFGRYQVSRISLFLNHWLVAQTGDEVGPRATFTRFKSWMEHESEGRSMSDVLEQLHAQAELYQGWVAAAARRDGSDLDAAELFVYRTQAANIEVVKPALLWLYDVRRTVSDDERRRTLKALESWILRRAMLRLPTNDLGRTISALVQHLRTTDSKDVAERTEEFLVRQRRRSTYWPGDAELRREVPHLPVYRRYPRSLLRMLLETAEDARRGYSSPHGSKTGQRISRHWMAIEHLLPQKWRVNWPVSDGLAGEIRRDEHVHRLGNLTLLTSSLNSAVSNAPWKGTKGKHAALRKHDVILMNRDIRDKAQESWTETDIDARSIDLVDALILEWPVPSGHVGGYEDRQVVTDDTIDLRTLLSAGVLHVGDVVHGRWDKDQRAVIGNEGILRVGDKEFSSPSGAARELRGKQTHGWWYLRVADGRTLKEVREDYARSLVSQTTRTTFDEGEPGTDGDHPER